MRAAEWESARTQHNCQSQKKDKRTNAGSAAIVYRISSIACVTYCLLLYNLNLLWFYFWSNDSHSIALFKPKIFPFLLLSLSLSQLTTVFLCLCCAFNGSAFLSLLLLLLLFYLQGFLKKCAVAKRFLHFILLISFTWLPQNHFGIRSRDRQ